MVWNLILVGQKQKEYNMKIFTKSIATLVLIIALVSCSGFDPVECYNSVVKAYPDSEVFTILGEQFSFIVRTSHGDILYVETMNNMNTDVTKEVYVIRGDG